MQRSPTELIARIRGQDDTSRARGAPRPRQPLRGVANNGRGAPAAAYSTRKRRSLSEFESTLTDDRAMATAAYTGSSRMPKAG
jgi:hypothetical protein